MGPVDYLVVGFPGNKFSGKIAPELAALEKSGIIRIIDFVFVLKDANGKLDIKELKDLKDETGNAFSQFAKSTNKWFSEGDIEVIVESLPNNNSVGLLLFENIWAIRFKEALLDADAELIDTGRIPSETIAMVEKTLLAEGSA